MLGNKRTIPELRDRLREIAEEEGLEELNDIADELKRRSPVRRAENKSAPLTPELAQLIRDFAEANPDWHQRDIAEEFNVNQGRVSEALNNQV